jgi:hypothetical protein
MKKNQKPYFSDGQLDAIVAAFESGMQRAEREYGDVMLEAVRAYARSPKTAYENAVLAGVAEGRYSMMEKEGKAAYAVVRPADLENHAREYESAKRRYQEDPTDPFAEQELRKIALNAVEKNLKRQLEQFNDNNRNLSHAMNMIAQFGKHDAGDLSKFAPRCPTAAYDKELPAEPAEETVMASGAVSSAVAALS